MAGVVDHGQGHAGVVIEKVDRGGVPDDGVQLSGHHQSRAGVRRGVSAGATYRS